MRRSTRWWLVGALGAAAAGVSTAGCYRGCGDDATCLSAAPGDSEASGSGGGSGSGGEGGTGGGGTACPNDPAEGLVSDECGVWVRTSSPGNDLNAGTQAAPVKTLAKAIALAQAGATKRVYACGETYVEHVDLPAGVALFGGFDCEHGWHYSDKLKRATLAPGVPGVTALTLLNGEGESIVGEIKAVAADATAPGGSSIAVFVMASSKATIRRSELIAGNGVDGADGEPGEPNGAPAQKGLLGNDGANACAMNPGLGGASVLLQCEAGSGSTSGYGGDGGAMVANAGGNGQIEPTPNLQGQGAGGTAEDLAKGLSCSAGIGGAQGADGADGVFTFATGFLTADGRYVGVRGGDGEAGLPGQGGGGGGASTSKALCLGAPPGGAGGGSGGTGGCGGKGGKGGQGGGSSFAMVVRAEGMRMRDITFRTGLGGNGGNGGVGQLPGQGGLPGLGGLGMVNGIKSGCGGGLGGTGGKGGTGAGGAGGHSVSVATTAFNTPQAEPQEHHNGSPGQGGDGGSTFPGKGYAGASASHLSLTAE